MGMSLQYILVCEVTGFFCICDLGSFRNYCLMRYFLEHLPPPPTILAFLMFSLWLNQSYALFERISQSQSALLMISYQGHMTSLGMINFITWLGWCVPGSSTMFFKANTIWCLWITVFLILLHSCFFYCFVLIITLQLPSYFLGAKVLGSLDSGKGSDYCTFYDSLLWVCETKFILAFLFITRSPARNHVA